MIGGQHLKHMPRPSSSAKKALEEIRAALGAKNYEEALSLSKNVLKADPSNYHAYVYTGIAATAQKNAQLAIQSYQRAIELRNDLPHAYRGLVETLAKPFAPQNPSLLARAHFGLGANSATHAGQALPKAADAFFALALHDESSRDEALSVLRAVRNNDSISLSSSYRDALAFRICKLLSCALVGKNGNAEDAEVRAEALEKSPLREALDDLEASLLRSNNPAFYDGTAQLVLERGVSRCQNREQFEQSLSLLRRLNAHDALLQVAETDLAFDSFSYDSRVDHALHSMHLSPHANFLLSRAPAVLACHVYAAQNDLERASQMARTSITTGVVPNSAAISPKIKKVENCSHAFVLALLHLHREEFKLSIVAATAGQKLTEREGCRKRMYMMLSLLMGAALCGDRRYKDATAAYGRVRDFAKEVDDSWLELAAHRGLVETAVTGYGRQSRQAITAVEEAAACEGGGFGICESIWSDALLGDIDVNRMTELTVSAVQNSKTPLPHEAELSWEKRVLHSRFAFSPAEMAATLCTRLGQMILKVEGYSPSALSTAQRHHMEAAGLVGNICDPFAHLGFIFEQMAMQGDEEKMRVRAIRCYERALDTNAAHPVASRRLARMLHAKGLAQEAVAIARNASSRNPKAHWAFNMLGWWRLARGKENEAAISFQSALRARGRKTPREEEALFGTNVGVIAEDNELLVDVDSWRGLSFSYSAQGRVGAACACLEDALQLVKEPPSYYVVGDSMETRNILKACRLILEAERSVLLVTNHNSVLARATAESLVTEPEVPLTVGYYNAEALVQVAAEEWIRGCYGRATALRKEAGLMLEGWVTCQRKRQQVSDVVQLVKRVGDIWMEACGECPLDMVSLVSNHVVDEALKRALAAYSKAWHLTPWDRSARAQDVAAILLKRAMFIKEEKCALNALTMLMQNDVSGALLGMAFVTFISLSSSKPPKSMYDSVVRGLATSAFSSREKLLLNASIALTASVHESVDTHAACAIRATQLDPTEWRAWLAVGHVRECDAERNGWVKGAVESCMKAYQEADRLGGGPAAVKGRLRCMQQMLPRCDEVDRATYAEANLGLGLAARVGEEEPRHWREMVDEWNQAVVETAGAKCEQLRHAGASTQAVYSHVHMFPFVEAVRSLSTTFAADT